MLSLTLAEIISCSLTNPSFSPSLLAKMQKLQNPLCRRLSHGEKHIESHKVLTLETPLINVK